MKNKLFFTLFSMLFILGSLITSNASNDARKSLYFKEDYENFRSQNTTFQEKVEYYKLETSLVDSLSTAELVEAVLDYPLRVVVYLHNSDQSGLNKLSEYSSAYQELLTREDALDEILLKLNSFEGNANAETGFLEIILRDNRLPESSNISSTVETEYASYYVKTPNGTNVEVYKFNYNDELDVQEKQHITQDVKDTFPNVQIVGIPTIYYNCHSYAWYLQSNGNKYWMNYPNSYMDDGSYSRVDFNSIRNNHKVFYEEGDHSGVVRQADSDTLRIKVISKWGKGPLVIHKIDDCPYSLNGLSFWKR